MGLFKIDTIVNGGTLDFTAPPGEVVNAVCVNGTDTLDITAKVRNGRILCDVPPGTWKIFVVSKAPLYEPFQVSMNPTLPKGRLSSHYPSLMIPEVTEAFLKIPHKRYSA